MEANVIMNISSVSATNSAVTSSKYDGVINALQKQKDELTKQIAEIKASKQDSKTKAEKINELTKQIAEIDQQIVQAKLNAKQKEIQEAQQKNAEKAAIKNYEQQLEENGPGVVLSPSLNKLLAADKNISDYQTLHTVRMKIKGEIAVAQSEIANSHGGSVKYQMDVVGDKESALAGVANKMAQKAEEISKDIKSSVKSGIKEAEKDRENKDEVKEDGKAPASTHSSADADINTDKSGPTDSSRDSKIVLEAQEEDKTPKDDRPKNRSINITV